MRLMVLRIQHFKKPSFGQTAPWFLPRNCGAPLGSLATWKDPLLRTFQEDEPLHGPCIAIYFLCISYIFPVYLLYISLHNPTQAWLFCWRFGQKWDPAALLHDMPVPTARIWLVQSSARLSSRQALASDAASLSNFMMLIYVNVSNRCSMIFWHNTCHNLDICFFVCGKAKFKACCLTCLMHPPVIWWLKFGLFPPHWMVKKKWIPDLADLISASQCVKKAW